MELLVVVVVLLALLAVVLAAALLAPRRRRSPGATAAPPRPQPAPPDGPAGPGTRTTAEPATAPPTTAPPAGSPAAPPATAAVPGVERPVPAAGRLVRLRARLAGSRSVLGRGLLALLSGGQPDQQVWDEVEEVLIGADVGVAAAAEIVGRLRERSLVHGTGDQDGLRALLREELLAALQPDLDRELHTFPHADGPAVVLVVGVNGTGKTTTCGKIARLLAAEGRSVVLGAADTFRAAAVDQLATWGARVGARTVRGAEGADPASVAFDAVQAGRESHVDVVLIDTAGRLHTKVGLMDELGKVKRVVEKHGPVDETLLVLDATTGQNGLMQAKVFTAAVDVSGIVLTKLDGTAKGGIVVAVQRELGIPVKLVGLGEGPDDLAPFDPEAFVDALLGEPE